MKELFPRSPDRGINYHNRFTAVFYDIFGSGTVAVRVGKETCYLNKASCYKWLNDIDKIDESHEVDFEKFKKSTDESIVDSIEIKLLRLIKHTPESPSAEFDIISKILKEPITLAEFVEEATSDPSYELYSKDAKTGHTAMTAAVVGGNVELLKVLNESAPGLINESDEKGCTPLIYAVLYWVKDQKKATEMIRFLLHHGAASDVIVPEVQDPFTRAKIVELHLRQLIEGLQIPNEVFD